MSAPWATQRGNQKMPGHRSRLCHDICRVRRGVGAWDALGTGHPSHSCLCLCSAEKPPHRVPLGSPPDPVCRLWSPAPSVGAFLWRMWASTDLSTWQEA